MSQIRFLNVSNPLASGVHRKVMHTRINLHLQAAVLLKRTPGVKESLPQKFWDWLNQVFLISLLLNILKFRYLEESIMALNASDPITKEHMPQVLESLNEQLQISINNLNQTEPTNKCIKPLKMLLMASKSLLHGD